MPTYQFRSKTTGDITEKVMKIAEKEQFLVDNPDLESYHGSAPSVGDPVRLGVRKVDNGFKEVLQKIHSRAPGSQLNKMANF